MAPSAARRVLPGSPFGNSAQDEPEPQHFEVDERVSHDRHGLGKVVSVEGETAVSVDFGGNIQRFACTNRKLQKL